jgi:hypothetical protein
VKQNVPGRETKYYERSGPTDSFGKKKVRSAMFHSKQKKIFLFTSVSISEFVLHRTIQSFTKFIKKNISNNHIKK